jgi:predicted glycosyltransferase
MTGSVLLYVQYLLGIGHLQRSLRIAEELAGHGVNVTFVAGGVPVPTLAIHRPGIQIVRLPPITALDARFELIDAATGQPVGDDLREMRRQKLLAAFDTAQPDAVVIEGFPFARRAFRFELDPLIAAAKARPRKAKVICSVRDIVNPRNDPVRHAKTVERVLRDFDAVLVHGDPRLVAFDASFPAAADIACRLTYTGYVTESRGSRQPAVGDDGAGEILVSGGGGPAGYALMQTAIQARRLGYARTARWRLLAGATVTADRFNDLVREAPEGVVVDRFRPDFTALLRRCLVSVSQAGYNTALELLAACTRAVLVPFAAEREIEQTLRAERLAALGAAELVPERELSPERLGSAIERAAEKSPVNLSIDMAGAKTSAEIIAGIIGGKPNPSGAFVAGDLGGMIVQ